MKITVEVGSKGQARLIEMMALKLKIKGQQHIRKWTKCDLEYLFRRLKEEAEELGEASGRDFDMTWAEAADVANFAAMIADVKTSLPENTK